MSFPSGETKDTTDSPLRLQELKDPDDRYLAASRAVHGLRVVMGDNIGHAAAKYAVDELAATAATVTSFVMDERGLPLLYVQCESHKGVHCFVISSSWSELSATVKRRADR